MQVKYLCKITRTPIISICQKMKINKGKFNTLRLQFRKYNKLLWKICFVFCLNFGKRNKFRTNKYGSLFYATPLHFIPNKSFLYRAQNWSITIIICNSTYHSSTLNFWTYETHSPRLYLYWQTTNVKCINYDSLQYCQFLSTVTMLNNGVANFTAFVTYFINIPCFC